MVGTPKRAQAGSYTRTRASNIWTSLRTAWQESKSGLPESTEVNVSSLPSSGRSRLERLQEGAAAVFFFATFGTVVVEVVARYVGHPVVWALELPTYCFLWAFSLSASLADWHDDHLAFDLLAAHFSAGLRRFLHALTNVIFAAVFIAVIPGTLSFLSYEAGQPNTGLPLSQAYGDAGIVLLFGLGALLRVRLLVQELGRTVWGRRERNKYLKKSV